MPDPAPWTIKEDIEAVLVGVEAGELVAAWRAWIAAADETARILGLFHPRNDEAARVLNGYWRARSRQVPG